MNQLPADNSMPDEVRSFKNLRLIVVEIDISQFQKVFAGICQLWVPCASWQYFGSPLIFYQNNAPYQWPCLPLLCIACTGWPSIIYTKHAGQARSAIHRSNGLCHVCRLGSRLPATSRSFTTEIDLVTLIKYSVPCLTCRTRFCRIPHSRETKCCGQNS